MVADSLGATRMPWAWSSRQVPTVRRSCQPSPGPTGTPVARSHTMVEARWLAMPTAVDRAAVGQAARGHLEDGVGHGHGVELDQPGDGSVGQDRHVVDVLDGAVGSHHRGPHPGGAHVDDQDAHGQPAPSPKGRGQAELARVEDAAGVEGLP